MRRNRRPQFRWRAAFTLTEVLVVLLIVAALAAIAYPVGASMLAKSRRTACLANLRQIGVGLEGYLQDHAQQFPEIAAGRKSKMEEVPVLETVLASYLSSTECFHCPADHEIFPKSGSSYIWNSTQSGQNRNNLKFLGKTGEERRIPLVADKEDWHAKENGVNFLYADLSASMKIEFGVNP